jgi:hypothetical protein
MDPRIARVTTNAGHGVSDIKFIPNAAFLLLLENSEKKEFAWLTVARLAGR